MSVLIRGLAAGAALCLSAGCAVTQGVEDTSETPALTDAAPVHPDLWPADVARSPKNPDLEQRIETILAGMTDEEKVGQLIQGEQSKVTPDDVRRYHLGSVLNGGGSIPGGEKRSGPDVWLEKADAYWAASMDDSNGRTPVPLIWGTDAVHGNNNVYGATIFPHNIGLGAARDPALIERIGAATAQETLVTGHDWSFAPTLAVVQDDRWGRSYESYSEDPEIVASYAGAYVSGAQGAQDSADFLGRGHVIATAKHFLGDGGTANGKDQGDNQASEAELRDIHAAGYLTALEAGVQTVMASFSSWQGEKMHGHYGLLTSVLKERMGFDGFVVGDWNGHGQVEGCTNASCARAINAGVDMVMVPDDWEALWNATLAQVKSGEISQARLDDAVRRILRVKLRAGLFEAPKPSDRPLSGDAAILGSDAHRALARQAVRESLVLLKNEGGVLPLKPGQTILIAGDGADNIGKQTGGWTLSWQGADNENADFPNGQSIYGGFRDSIEAAGGTAMLSVDGAYDSAPDVAVVVFGEDPYAEFQGDRDNLAYSPGDDTDLELLKRLKMDGIPTVAVFLSGRPMWVNPYLNAADAFVAAWLPGSEGGGVADVLLADADGGVAHDFHGTLSFSWPRKADQTPLNIGDADYDPLFPVGYGLTYSDTSAWAALDEDPGIELGGADARTNYFADGRAVTPWRLNLAEAEGGSTLADGASAQSANKLISVVTVDREVQEDSRRVSWAGTGGADVMITGFDPVDLTREANGAMALVIQARVDSAPEAPVMLGLQGADGEALLDVTGALSKAGDGWFELRTPLRCFSAAGLAGVTTPVLIRTGGALSLSFSEIRLQEQAPSDACPS